jgi:cytochrome c biogenesis protein CcmG/thiol:disulfide interchange protein DsbE
MSIKQLILVGTVVAIGGALAVAATVTRRPADPTAAVAVEGPMPAIDRPAMQGGRVGPATYRGKVVLVNFWASWCGPCRREQPGLERLWREYGDRDVQLLGINFDDGRAAALEYLREFGVTYPSVYDPDGKITADFLVPFLPATVLVDADGQMRYRLQGAQTEATLRRYLDELLAEA